MGSFVDAATEQKSCVLVIDFKTGTFALTPTTSYANKRRNHTMKHSRESEDAHARAKAAEQASDSTKLDFLHISDPSSQFTVIPSRCRRPGIVQRIRVYHAETDIKSMQHQQQSVRHSARKTEDTDIPSARESCGGCLSEFCAECAGILRNNTATLITEPQAEILGSGRSLNDCIEEMQPGIGGVHSTDINSGSTTCEDFAPRYLEDGPTWSFDTLGGNGDSDDGIDSDPALGSDNSDVLERRMMEVFGGDDDAEASRSSIPVRNTPTSGSDHDCVLEEDQGVEFRTPPSGADLAQSEPSEISFEQALSFWTLTTTPLSIWIHFRSDTKLRFSGKVSIALPLQMPS